MSIVPLVKVTLYGPASEKAGVLDGLQRLGCLHLNDLRPAAAELTDLSHSGVAAREAWQYLQDCPVHRQALKQATDVDLQATAKDALDIRDRSRALAEEREQLHKWIVDLKPWGDFELPAWGREGPLRFWFYIVPLRQVASLQVTDLALRIVARDHRFAYVVVVAASQPAGMPVTPVALEPRSLSTLRARLEQVERDLEELDYRRIGLTLYRDMLGNSLDEADDRAARDRAALVTLEQDQVFAVQGWVPSERASSLRQFADDRELAVTIEAPSTQDVPPTLLDNPSA
jgi:V/A-type H+-transporting ATPase subunit I